jgi:hypothetical protein
MHNYAEFHGIFNTYNYEGGSRLTQTLFLFLKSEVTLHSLSACGHAPHFCALELIQDGNGPYHSECRTAMYHQIPCEIESKTSRNSSWVKCTLQGTGPVLLKCL